MRIKQKENVWVLRSFEESRLETVIEGLVPRGWKVQAHVFPTTNGIYMARVCKVGDISELRNEIDTCGLDWKK